MPVHTLTNHFQDVIHRWLTKEGYLKKQTGDIPITRLDQIQWRNEGFCLFRVLYQPHLDGFTDCFRTV